MRYIVVLVSVLLVTLLVFQKYQAHQRELRGVAIDSGNPFAARQKSIDVTQFVGDAEVTQPRAIDEQAR